MRRVLNSWWIAILVSLSLSAMLVVPQFSTTSCSPISKALSDQWAIRIALDLFHSRNHRYPSTEEGLKALAPEFLLRLSRDPWGNEYAYRTNSKGSYVLYSLGVDAQDDGGARDDITSRKKDYECRHSCGVDASKVSGVVLLALMLLASALVGLAWGIRRVYRSF
jgi:general secretion pathway protein G